MSLFSKKEFAIAPALNAKTIALWKSLKTVVNAERVDRQFKLVKHIQAKTAWTDLPDDLKNILAKVVVQIDNRDC